jgi:hypothetical protein
VVAAAADEPEVAGVPDTPDMADVPDAPDLADVADTPDTSEVPGAADADAETHAIRTTRQGSAMCMPRIYFRYVKAM